MEILNCKYCKSAPVFTENSWATRQDVNRSHDEILQTSGYAEVLCEQCGNCVYIASNRSTLYAQLNEKKGQMREHVIKTWNERNKLIEE